MKKIFTLLLLLSAYPILAQQEASATETIKATEFTIPAAPAYILLDASSPLVNQPSNVRDFKVDWSLKSYRLQPNIALEGQPLWEILYNRADISKYQKASAFMRTLSTLSLSAGTLQKDITIQVDSVTTATVPLNQLAAAIKFNVYRQHDPLLDVEMYEPLVKNYEQQKKSILDQIQSITTALDTMKNAKQKKTSLETITNLKASLVVLNNSQKEAYKQLRGQYIADKWNSSHVDVAVGQIYNFTRPTLDSLDLFNKGFGVWVNGSYGVGKHGLLCGTVRWTNVDTVSTFGTGVNFRYGNQRYNFFAETMYNVSSQVEKGKDIFTLAYGGDFKVGNNVIIGYAIRTVLDKNLKIANLIPVANINCLMR